MRLEGSLDAFGLPDVLALLAMTSKTGHLHLHRALTEDETVDAQVTLRAGLVAGVRADVRAQTLARRVLAASPVAPDELAPLVEGSRLGGDLVDALVGASLVDASTVRTVAESDVVEALAALLEWQGGSFAFEAVDEPAGAAEVAVPVDQLVARARELPELPEHPAPGLVLALAPSIDEQAHVAPDEWPLLLLVDGRRSVADVVAVAGRSPRAVLGSLGALLERGLLREGQGGADAAVARHTLLASLEGSAEQPATPSVVQPPVALPVAQPEPEPALAPLGALPQLAPDPSPLAASGWSAEPEQAEQASSGWAAAPLAPAVQDWSPTDEPADRPTVSATPAHQPSGLLPDPLPPAPVAAFSAPVTALRPSAPAGLTLGSTALDSTPDAAELEPATDEQGDGAPSDVDVTKTLLLRLIAGVRGL